MMKRTHTLIGAALGLTLALHTQQQPVIALALMVVTSSAAVAPDLDIRLGLKHRGITHSLVALWLIALPCLLLLPLPYAWFIPVGYLSHLIADALTPHGVPLLMPLPYRVRIARLRTGGVVDTLIGAAAGVVSLALVWQMILI